MFNSEINMLSKRYTNKLMIFSTMTHITFEGISTAIICVTIYKVTCTTALICNRRSSLYAFACNIDFSYNLKLDTVTCVS